MNIHVGTYCYCLFFYPDNQLIGKIVPSSIVATVKSNVELTCYSMTTPYWTKDGYSIPSDFIEDGGATFRKVNARGKDSGRYYCVGTNQRGKNFKYYADIYIACKFFCKENYFMHVCLRLLI